MTEQFINPIHSEYIPRLTKDFINLYNDNAANRIASHQVPIEESRANPTKYSFLYGARPAQKVSRKTDHTIPVPAGGSIHIRVYESESSLDKHNRSCYINFHGGGWVFGGFETDKRFCSRICNEVGCVVVDVDYRLAPEFPWPAQLQDSWAALLWVRENAEILKIDSDNIAIGGCSAGAHIAAILSQRCLALKIPLKLQILTVPATDLTVLSSQNWSLSPTCPYPSYLENCSAPCLPLERVQFFMRHLLGPQFPDPIPAAELCVLGADVELSPMKAGTLKGLAPALVSTADVDILRDDGEEYARKLSGEGVEVRIKRYMGVPHPFVMMDEGLEEAREYILDCCDSLRRVFNGESL